MKENINIIKRIEKLEAVVFGSNKKKKNIKTDSEYNGPTGGVKFLIDKGFFNNKQALSQVRDELNKNGYHYSIQAAQTALSRLSKLGGLLVSLKESGKKVYVKRK